MANWRFTTMFAAVLGIRDILVWIQIWLRSSVTLRMQKIGFTCGHIIFNLKNFIFCYSKFCVKILFCKHYFSPINTFLRKGKDPDPETDPDPCLWLMDPVPGGPETCGSGSPTLVCCIYHSQCYLPFDPLSIFNGNAKERWITATVWYRTLVQAVKQGYILLFFVNIAANPNPVPVWDKDGTGLASIHRLENS